MTVTNYMQVNERGVLMMDGASIDETGRVVGLAPKGLHIPEWGGFIAGSGNVDVARAISQLVIPEFAGIDDLAENGEAGFRTARETMVEQHPEAFGSPWHVIVAAWSDAKQRTRAVYFGSNDDIYFEADFGHWVQPFPADDEWRAFLASLSATGGPASFGPITHGMPLIESQRRRPMGDSDDGFADGQHFIGGSVQVTEIGRDGVTQRIVHTWHEDEIGERIRPAVFLDPAQHANVSQIGLNRQQRRALARQRGRAA